MRNIVIIILVVVVLYLLRKNKEKAAAALPANARPDTLVLPTGTIYTPPAGTTWADLLETGLAPNL